MNKTLEEAKVLSEVIKNKLEKNEFNVDVVLIPPFINLVSVYEIVKNSNIGLGAQNLFWEKSGAYTGEISAAMIKSTGAEYVVIGHSERRQYFSETDETVNKRLLAALQEELKPIVCIGETLEQRQNGSTNQVIESQIKGAFKSLSASDIEKIIIAYEPVWAIGTGMTATPEQAEETHVFIRKTVAQLANDDVAENIRIQYGGSVKPENAAQILSKPNVDGALIGGASLNVDSFIQIISAAQ